MSGGDAVQDVSRWRVDDVQSEGITRCGLHFLFEPPSCGNGICLQRSLLEELRLNKHFTQPRQGDRNLVLDRGIQYRRELVERSQVWTTQNQSTSQSAPEPIVWCGTASTHSSTGYMSLNNPSTVFASSDKSQTGTDFSIPGCGNENIVSKTGDAIDRIALCALKSTALGPADRRMISAVAELLKSCDIVGTGCQCQRERSNGGWAFGD